MISESQAEHIKKQLITQIESSFPEDKKAFAISQINAMDSVALEDFLVKNGLVKGQENQTTQNGCVFCAIVSGDINSHKIAENSKAIAVLEINPLSYGHLIIIPKEHISSETELPAPASVLSKKMSSIIKSKLKPKEVKIESSNVMGHEILNIIPFYDNSEKDFGERKRASPEELSELLEVLTKKIVAKTISKKKSKKTEKFDGVKKIFEEVESKLWLPKRIP